MGRIAVLTILFAGSGWLAPQTPTIPLEVAGVQVTLLEEAWIPASEAGMLTDVAVREGNVVGAGDILARIDDRESQLASQRAAVELEIAQKEAGNDAQVRFASKSLEMAKAEVKRAADAIERYKKSVSQTEMDQLRRSVERSEAELAQAQHEFEVSQLTVRLKENALEAARQQVDRRRIVAPIAGVVAEIEGRRGQWVQPGANVARIVRLDRLRAEAFVSARRIDAQAVGSSVKLSVELRDKRPQEFSGTLVFVSSEVDPVNGEVRVWAEIDNPEQLLRPGLKGTLLISSEPALRAEVE